MMSAVAVAAPRFHDQLEPNILEMEYRYDNETVAYMISRGHSVTRVENESADVNVVRRLPNGTFEAASETRQDNSAGFGNLNPTRRIFWYQCGIE
jgi:gamma-glutamyltranspeptidase / glutathione hydrolase